MHPSIQELLSFRDSPEDAFVASHLEHCTECAAELQVFKGTQAALRSLPHLDPPNDAWTRIQAAASVADTRHANVTHVRARAVLAVALAAGIAAFTVLFVLRNAQEPSPSSVGPESAAIAPDMQTSNALTALVEQSRELDVLLQRLPERPRVERVSTAATLDTLEERIEWLDFQLSYAAAGELDETHAQTLWRQRVELMDSLVKVRYAQSGHVSF